MAQHYAGTSFTVANPGYSGTAQAYQRANYRLYDFTFTNQARNGNNTWSNLVRLETGQDIFIIDHANDGDTDWHKSSLEAIIRKVWNANPETGIVIIGSPSWGGQDTSDNGIVSTPSNLASLNAVKALAQHYGIAYVDYLQWCIDNVPSVYDLADLVADTVHPTQTGYNAIAELLEVFLPNSGTPKPVDMPDFLYDENGLMSNSAVTYRNGNANDGETGSGWSTVATTGRQSSTAGDTITFNNVTCGIIGALRDDAVNMSVDISINGGAFVETYLLYQNGNLLPNSLPNGTYNVTFRVRSGQSIRIDRLMATVRN